MIRILQQDNRIVKGIFALIIGAAIVTMVITLVPGVFDSGAANDATVFATVRNPGFFGRISGDTTPIRMADVMRETQQQMRRQNLPDFYQQFLVSRVGQEQVERAVLVREADHLGLQVSDEDLRRELRQGTFGQYIYPNGQYIGDEHYMDFVQSAFGLSVAQFEKEVKQDMEVQRLQALVTGSVSVSDAAARADYLKTGTKIKFDYASISADDIKKTINPSDADLQAFFKQNAARYAQAVPETRKLQFFAIDNASIPGAKSQVTDAQVEAYYNAHLNDYKVPEQVQTRHILISVPRGASAQVDAAAKAKAQDVLKQVQSGGNFADLAKKYSDDPGSKDSGGALPMMATAQLDPAYAQAAMALSPGQTSGLVRSQFGYHIIQTIARQPAHTRSLAEVKDQISQQLQTQQAASVAQNYANQLAAEAKSKGMAETAAAHNLKLETTDFVARDGVIASLPDSTQVLTAAFNTTQGAPPAAAPTGEGYAIFQVTGVMAAHAPGFADWKDHVLDDYRAQKAPEALNQQLIKLSDLAKKLNSLDAAAKQMNITVQHSDLVGRDAQVQGVGSLSGQAAVAFDLPINGISGPINEGPNGAVLQLTDKQQPKPQDIAQNLPATKQRLLQQQQQEAFAVFAGNLIQRYENAGAIVYSRKQSGLPLGG